MTDTATDRPVETSTTGTGVTAWLADFERALAAENVDAAVDLFVVDCFWRDLVAFTWNIVTVEGHEGVRDLLGKNLHRVQPRGFAVAGELGGEEAPGEAWIKFETSVGRGIGQMLVEWDER